MKHFTIRAFAGLLGAGNGMCIQGQQPASGNPMNTVVRVVGIVLAGDEE
jgi:hypothetical protein